MESNDGNPQDPPSPIIEVQSKPTGVAAEDPPSAEDEATQQQAPVPDPRWPYLGRWSESPKPVSTVTPPSMVTGTESKAPPVVVSGPPPSTGAIAVSSRATETTAASQATVSHPPTNTDVETTKSPPLPGSLTHELNEAAEGIIPLEKSAVDAIPGIDDSDTEPGKDTGFVRSLGAWSKPLHFTPPPTPSEPATPRIGVSEEVKNQIISFWPSLGESVANGQKKKKGKFLPAQATPLLPVEKIPPPALKDDGSLRFPWAARMNQSSRNLFRAAEPTYRLDGTPQVTIPSSVLKLGPENNEEYLIGQFHRCSSPPGGLIHAVLNRLWGRECKISCKKLGDASYLFHIPHENTRKWVVQRGVWHVDDCLLFVAPWSPANSLKTPEISTLPVWVTLKNIPDSCFSRLGISHIASGLGEPMLTHRPRLDPTIMGEAKILVEVELDKPFPKLIALDDKQGNIFFVVVEYAWMPSACGRCGALGHKEKRCLLPPKPLEAHTEVQTAETQVINEEIPVVDIDKVMQNTMTSHGDHFVPESHSPPSRQDRGTPTDFHVTKPSEVALASLSTNSLEVNPTPCSKNVTILSTLAVVDAAPSQSQIMEEIPSQIIILEDSAASEIEQAIGVFTPITQNNQQSHMGLEPPVSYGEEIGPDVVGESSSYLTRGGRSVKPTQKIQELGWTKVGGRGKRGRRGRGDQFH